MSPTTLFLIIAFVALTCAKPEEHYANGKHNKQYDREAFLGPEVDQFNQLSMEESVRRLGVIVDKIDKDGDGQITHEELKDWIRLTQRMYIVSNVDRQWQDMIASSKNKEYVTWDEYSNFHYGYRYEDEYSLDEDNQLLLAIKARDERRWKRADADKDGKLSKEEFAAFLHPEDYDYMKELIVIETMEELDRNNDGMIDLHEYIGDLYHPEEHEEGGEPEWVRYEREQFKIYRDKDGDSVMNLDEVRDWVLPEDFDHADAEASHLIHEADADADQKLTKKEIIDKYDLFVGSQATDFGEALTRHDEF